MADLGHITAAKLSGAGLSPGELATNVAHQGGGGQVIDWDAIHAPQDGEITFLGDPTPGRFDHV